MKAMLKAFKACKSMVDMTREVFHAVAPASMSRTPVINQLIKMFARSVKPLMLPASRLLNYARAGPVRVVRKTLHIKASE